MTDLVKQVIAARKATRATGARKGIRMVAPTTKREYTKGKTSTKTKAGRAAYQRAYRAKMTTQAKTAAQDRQNARRRAITAGTPYVYLPGIPAARDRRRSGDLLEQYYNEITARIAISDANLVAVAHSEFERELDVALQIARRPQGIRHPWEFRKALLPAPRAGYHRLPMPDRSVKYVNKPRMRLADLQAK